MSNRIGNTTDRRRNEEQYGDEFPKVDGICRLCGNKWIKHYGRRGCPKKKIGWRVKPPYKTSLHRHFEAMAKAVKEERMKKENTSSKGEEKR